MAAPFPPRYFQIDGGDKVPRAFNSPPEARGYLAFTPTAPVFYLVAVDERGYEVLVDIFLDKDAALTKAIRAWRAYDVTHLVDLTERRALPMDLLLLEREAQQAAKH